MNADRELVDAVLAGAPGAFARLVRTHQNLCRHMVQRLVRDPEDVRDLCQETFLRVHRTLRQYRGDSALGTWIGRIAWNLALRHLQRKRLLRAEPHGANGPDPLDQVAGDDDLETTAVEDEHAALLHAAIERLPAVQRGVLSLYHLDELTISEIATITQLAEGTVKSHLFRARARLRQLLENRIGVCP